MARRSRPTSSARPKGGATEGGAFVDDRALPAYVRASEAAAARAARWDELLKAECPEALGARVKV